MAATGFLKHSRCTIQSSVGSIERYVMTFMLVVIRMSLSFIEFGFNMCGLSIDLFDNYVTWPGNLTLMSHGPITFCT